MRILESFQQPGPRTNPYLVGLLNGLRKHHHVSVFSWRTALFDQFDVFHVHWPEVLLRGDRWWKTAGRSALFAALLTKLWATGTPIVRTLHNPAPHEPPHPAHQGLIAWLNKLTTSTIHLTAATVPHDARSNTTITDDSHTVIKHTHYRDHLTEHPRSQPVPGRFVFAGLIRNYKNVPELIAAFRAIPDDTVSLRIVGTAQSEALRAEITDAMGNDPRISTDLRYLTDADLVTEITSAGIVVLPYRELHNSGMALMALSLDRPVLLPHGPSSTELAAELPDWVHTYSGPLTPETLVTALRNTPATPTCDLKARGLDAAIIAHNDVFANTTR